MGQHRIFMGSLLTLLFLGVIAVIIVCFHAKNGKREQEEEPLPFWKTSIVYQIYPRSFLDSNADGIGDIDGITSKLDYLKELGVGVVWLSNICESPMKDFGYDVSNYTNIAPIFGTMEDLEDLIPALHHEDFSYDVSNYTDIDPIFGTMEDFEDLIDALHHEDIKLVMDFVPNHSSDQHEWFARSVKRDPKYADYYVWADAIWLKDGTRYPPNNWISEFGGSAWEWNEERNQYYYHVFLKEQPDLNYRNPNVRKEMEDVLTFWLEKGVDGFRVDALKYLLEDEDLTKDEPLNPDSGTNDPNDPDYLDHIYTNNQPGTFEVLGEWRKLVNHYTDKVLMVEVYSEVQDVMEYYGNETHPLADFPFNFFMIDNLQNRSDLTGDSLWEIVELWFDNLPMGKWSNWVLGNHDNSRVSSRLGWDLVDALNMVNLLLPGTPVTYYGEELGMEDTFVSESDIQDTQHRDPERTPMQWDNTTFAGFTTGNDTWLPVNPNYLTLNVQAQEHAEVSHLKIYRALAELRQEETFTRGTIAFPVITEDIFSFTRSYEDNEEYLVVINTSEQEAEINLHHHTNFPLPESATVIIRSLHDQSNHTHIGAEVSLEKIDLVKGGGLVMKLS